MTDQLLFVHACEMLERTNVFKKAPESLHYRNSTGETISLLSLVRDNREIKNRRMSSDRRLGRQKNDLACYRAIREAIVTYIRSYPAPCSFKSRMRGKFISWLRALQTEYRIPAEEQTIPEALILSEGEKDTVVMLLKSLQARGGITKKALEENLGIGPRAILKDMCKLDPSLRKDAPDMSEDEDSQSFYLGGQPVSAKIRSIKKKGSRANVYMTANTVHPIILQENLMQAGTLLLSLFRSCWDYDSNLSRYIALDIWFQLTPYAQERIRTVFSSVDMRFPKFLDELEDLMPDEQVLQMYQNERVMMNDPERNMSMMDRLIFHSKSKTRTCSLLVLETEDGVITLHDVRIEPASSASGERGYFAVTDDEEEQFFTIDQVVDLDGE
ncbi:MAG: hypothetical protein K6G27_06710 [Lachnospiraceae bacterium]|nr:hypothetical protein [Lachnospiraceae bacterium]